MVGNRFNLKNGKCHTNFKLIHLKLDEISCPCSEPFGPTKQWNYSDLSAAGRARGLVDPPQWVLERNTDGIA